MCGIIGCISQHDVTARLLDGLRKESYRGYDSSGMAVLGSDIACIKAVGKLEELEAKVAQLAPVGTVGIGHNRWATHGGVTEVNAHPHGDCRGNIFVVHNGIIENYQELKKTLIDKGHHFVSQTDTEVLAHLIEHLYHDNLEEAVRQALQLVRGTYGLIALAASEPDKLIAARLSSPLVLAVAGTDGLVASDPAALLIHTNQMVFLDDGELAVVLAGQYNVTDLANRVKYKSAMSIDIKASDAQRGTYRHFMEKEIFEQPTSLRNTLRGRLLVQEGNARLGGLAAVDDRLRSIERLNILACGTAYYAGMVGKYMIEEHAGIPCEVSIASEFRYHNPVVTPHTASLIISQSGETADTLAALQEVKRKGELTLGIVNVVGSSIARSLDAGLYNHAGPEIGVASTRAFTSQLAMLALLTVYLARQRRLSLAEGEAIIQELSALPERMSRFLAQGTARIPALAARLAESQTVLYLGRKYNYPIALEGALKLKEVSYIHAEGYSAGELKHGAIALIDKETPTVAICPQDSVYEKTLVNMQEVKSRSGPIVAVATEGDSNIADIADEVIYVPKTIEMLTPLLTVLPLQLLAYYAGLERERDVDRPRNLAKSVTVE